MKKLPVILIKLGGSVLTDKTVSNKLRTAQLRSLVLQIKRALKDNPDQQIVVGHGQGSFAHIPAAKYRTIEGFINKQSRLGMAIVQDKAAQLNRKVVAEFIAQGLPAVTLAMSNGLITAQHKAKKSFSDLLAAYLSKELLPITYGDVIADLKRGCTIWSTEEILGFLGQELLNKKYSVHSIVHVTEVAGFLDDHQKIIPEITTKTWPKLKKHLGKTRGVDVTGGMALKIEESLKLAKKGVPAVILSGKKDNLYRYLTGKTWQGTAIS